MVAFSKMIPCVNNIVSPIMGLHVPSSSLQYEISADGALFLAHLLTTASTVLTYASFFASFVLCNIQASQSVKLIMPFVVLMKPATANMLISEHQQENDNN